MRYFTIVLILIVFTLLAATASAKYSSKDCFFKEHKLKIIKPLSLAKDNLLVNAINKKITPINISLCNLSNFIERKTPPEVIATYSAVLLKGKPTIKVDIEYSKKISKKENSQNKIYRLYIDPVTANITLIKYQSRLVRKAYSRYAANYFLSDRDLNLLKYLIMPKTAIFAKYFNESKSTDEASPEQAMPQDDYFEFPQDANILQGDGIHPSASGTKVIANNNVAIQFNKIAIIGDSQISLLFDIYIGEEKLNIMPLIISGSIFSFEGKFYGLKVNVDKSYQVQGIPLKQIVKLIKNSNYISLEISSLISEKVTSCAILQNKCLEKNDAMSCSLICPNMPLNNQEKITTENINFFFSQTFDAALKESVQAAFAECYPKVKNYLQIMPYSKLNVKAYSKQDCPDCTYYVTNIGGIDLTLYEQQECGETFAHELTHYFNYASSLSPNILEEGRAVFISKDIVSENQGMQSSKGIDCLADSWKYSGEKPLSEKIGEETVCVNNATSNCGKKTLWQIVNTPVSLLTKTFSNGYTLKVQDYSSNKLSFDLFDEANQFLENVTLKPLEFFEGNNFLVHFGKIITPSPINQQIVLLLMLDDYNLQCFVENKQQCNVKASSWPENKFAKLEEATYSINSLNTGYCFFKALNSLSAGIVKALSEKMASSRNDFKVFCTEDFLKTKIQPSDLNILKQKYGLETYIDQCKFSAIPAALLGCPMNLGCYSYYDPVQGWVNIE